MAAAGNHANISINQFCDEDNKRRENSLESWGRSGLRNNGKCSQDHDHRRPKPRGGNRRVGSRGWGKPHLDKKEQFGPRN